MENITKYISASLTAFMGVLAPIEPLVVCASLFVSIDFLTGVLADRKRTLRNGQEWMFRSKKAWKTINKLCFIMAGIILAWLIDSMVTNLIQLNLAKIFTGFVCGVEFWSYLENASEISGQPVFSSFRKFIEKHFKDFNIKGNDQNDK